MFSGSSVDDVVVVVVVVKMENLCVSINLKGFFAFHWLLKAEDVYCVKDYYSI